MAFLPMRTSAGSCGKQKIPEPTNQYEFCLDTRP